MIRYRDQDFLPSLDLEVLRQYEGIPDQQIAAYIAADGLDHIQFGSHELKPWHDSTALINYVGPFHSYPHYSMVDVIKGRVPADAFRDKIVFVGATALGIGDLRNTPFQTSGYMGVEVHANILDNLLHSSEPHRTFLRRGFRQELTDIGFIALFGAVLGLVWPLAPAGRYPCGHDCSRYLCGICLFQFCPLGPMAQLGRPGNHIVAGVRVGY